MGERYAVTLNEKSEVFIDTPKDLMVFVPGTTDPVNTSKEIHAAYNKTYFAADRDNPFYPGKQPTMGPFPTPSNFIPTFEEIIGHKIPFSKELEDFPNFLEQIHKLKKEEFPYLELEDQWFSWSGDNAPDQRIDAGIALMQKLMKWFGAKGSNGNQTIWIHLVGHSHGGNVINEFTKAIATDGEFPEKWVIKSITYLSTPFFKEMHQVDETKFHPDCKIFNVFNEYDLTQRFVADYSVNDLAIFLDSILHNELFLSGMQRIHGAHLENPKNYDPKSTHKEFRKKADFGKIFEGLKESSIAYDKRIEIWKTAINLFKGLSKIFNLFFNLTQKSSQSEIRALHTLIKKIWEWSKSVITDLEEGLAEIKKNKNLKKKWYQFDVPYGTSLNFVADLNISTEQLGWFNTLFKIRTGPNDSYLFGLFEQLLIGSSGIINVIDDTTNTPEHQLKKFKKAITPSNITKLDYYDSRNKYESHKKFINQLEKAVKDGGSSGRRQTNIKEILFLLISQLDTSDNVKKIAGYVDTFATILNVIEWRKPLSKLYETEFEKQLEALRANLNTYADQVNTYNYHLVTPNDIADKGFSFMEKPGSLGYLAMVSHSLSHMLMTEEIKKELSATFGSPKKKK